MPNRFPVQAQLSKHAPNVSSGPPPSMHTRNPSEFVGKFFDLSLDSPILRRRIPFYFRSRSLAPPFLFPSQVSSRPASAWLPAHSETQILLCMTVHIGHTPRPARATLVLSPSGPVKGRIPRFPPPAGPPPGCRLPFANGNTCYLLLFYQVNRITVSLSYVRLLGQ